MIEIVCVSYRTPGDLERFCQSLLGAPPRYPWALTVVNVQARPEDHDAGQKIEYLFRHAHHEVTVWNTLSNIGYSRSCNSAAKTAIAQGRASDYLAFFNADVTLRPGAIDGCIEAMENNPDWGVVGPRQVDSKNRITHAGIFGTLDRPAHRAWQQLDSPEYADTRQAVTVAGSAYFVRRKTWDELARCPLFLDVAPGVEGAMLPTSHFYEETFLSYHAQAHGYPCYYLGSVVIQHEWHQASPVGGWADQQFPISREYFRKACDRHSIPHD